MSGFPMLGASMIITVIVCAQSRQRLFVGKVGKGRLRRGCVAAPRLVPAQLQSPQVPRDPRRRPWQTLEITIHTTQSIELEPQVLAPKYCRVKCWAVIQPWPKIFNPKFPTKKTHKHRKHFLVDRVSVHCSGGLWTLREEHKDIVQEQISFLHPEQSLWAS